MILITSRHLQYFSRYDDLKNRRTLSGSCTSQVNPFPGFYQVKFPAKGAFPFIYILTNRYMYISFQTLKKRVSHFVCHLNVSVLAISACNETPNTQVPCQSRCGMIRYPPAQNR